MRDLCPVHDDEVLKLGTVPDVTVVAHTCCPADIGMGPNTAIPANNTRAFDISSGLHYASFSDNHGSLHGYPIFYRTLLRRRKRTHQREICFKHVPRVSDFYL